jgi:hypothetical protein
VHLVVRMKTTPLLVALITIAGCRADEATIQGTLLDDDEAGWVWIDGETDRVQVAAGEFRLDNVVGDTIDLRFASDDGDEGRMRILGLRGGSTLTLDGVWIEDDWAFATAVGLEGSRVVEINRIRMAPAETLEGDLAIDGTLLAVSRGDDALIVRPSDDQLPDVRVVVTPATVIESVDGDPVSLSAVDFGDSMTVRGVAEGGYLMAAEIQFPRAVAVGAEPSSGEAGVDGSGDSSGGGPSDDDEVRVRDRDEDNRGRGRGPPRLGRTVGPRGRS